MGYQTTGVVIDCICGATDVPMAWGSGTHGSVRLYKHVKGRRYVGKSDRGEKCSGPDDLFTYMLRENKMMLMDFGKRLATRSEAAAHESFVAEFERRLPADGQGQLF